MGLNNFYDQAKAVNYNLNVKPPKNKQELYNNTSQQSFYDDGTDALEQRLIEGFQNKYPEQETEENSGNKALDEAAKIQQRRDNRENNIYDRFQTRNMRDIERIKNNPDNTERIKARMDRRAERFKERAGKRAESAANQDIDPNQETLGGKAMGAGISALQQAPSIINNLSSDVESSQEAVGRTLSLASSGAQIGMNFGPWGAAAGAVIGAGAGIIANKDWRGKIVRAENKQLMTELGDDMAERQQNYFLNKTQDQIAAERNIYSKSLGYS